MPRIAVAGPSRVVTDAGVLVGNEGGSVVDVAIVAALTAMCTEPGVCGPGGGGFLTVAISDADPVVIDGYMAFPGKGFNGEPYLREVTMPYGGGVTTLVDAGSVAVPGAFAALEQAWRMYGTMPWPELMEAVAGTVENGFPLSAACHLYLNDGAATIFQQDPVAREALLDGDASKPLGARILFPELADTLRHLGDSGATDFYDGDVAKMIVSDLQTRGGQLTAEDLRTYRAVVREPIITTLGEWSIALNPPPAIGGLTVASILDQLAPSSGAAGRARALIAAFETRQDGLKSPSTISVAAADDAGGAVAASFSAGYVSGVVPQGTGMLMNNALGELELTDGHGVPGERMVSNMAPTVASRGGDVVAVGSPGADRITTAVATTLVRLAENDTLQQAIDHPRVHPEFGAWGVRLAVEPVQDLLGLELPLRLFDAQHMYFGGVNGAGRMAGDLVAYADPRRTGAVGLTTPGG